MRKRRQITVSKGIVNIACTFDIEYAYLHLADVTAKMGLMAEATRLYRKLYNLCLTPESESAAAIGAGKCFYQTKDYKSAANG